MRKLFSMTVKQMVLVCFVSIHSFTCAVNDLLISDVSNVVKLVFCGDLKLCCPIHLACSYGFIPTQWLSVSVLL